MGKFSIYMDSSAPIGVPIRKFKKCPLCEKTTTGFVVIPDKKGYLLYCHNCGQKKWLPRSGFSPKAIKQILQSPPKAIQSECVLPSDFSYEIPAVGKVWLYTYGISEELIRTLGMGYSEKYNRLILPCYNNSDELVHWQGRYLGNYSKDSTPKYITRTKSGNYYWVHNPHGSQHAVLVEDIVSAIKVGTSGFAGVCLFGSHVSYKTLKNVAKDFSRISMWLDPDKRTTSIKFQRKFRSLGKEIKIIITNKKDPKEYSKKEIKSFVSKETTNESNV